MMNGYPVVSDDLPESSPAPDPVPEQGPTFPPNDWDGVDDINM
jgi:hypothetical protein